MSDAVLLMLPGGSVSTFSVPLSPAIAAQVAAGTLKPVEDTFPLGELDGEGGVSRVETPPNPVDPVVEEPAVVDPSTVAPPRGNASLSEWVEFAVSQGMPRDEALGLKRNDLKARFVLDNGEG